MGLDRFLAGLTYRYEMFLLVMVLMMLLWPLEGGFPAFVGTFALLLVILDARSGSQFKRGSEDFTMIDRTLGSIPFRYELLVLIAVVIWLLWWVAAGMSGCAMGLGLVFLAVRARSSSQLKRGSATNVEEVM